MTSFGKSIAAIFALIISTNTLFVIFDDSQSPLSKGWVWLLNNFKAECSASEMTYEELIKCSKNS
jgi:hypothetical protein